MGCSGSKNKVVAVNSPTTLRSLEPSASLHKMLTKERLDQYEDALVNQLGVSTSSDLALITDSDLQDLGMKPIEQRRFSNATRYLVTEEEQTAAAATTTSEAPQESKESSKVTSKAAKTASTVGAAAGSAAVTALEVIDTVESAVEVGQGELTETTQVVNSEGKIEDQTTIIDTYSGVFKLSPTTKMLLGSAFSSLESVAVYAPGAKQVLQLCAGIYERFQALREMSENIASALDVVGEVARHVATAGKTLKNVSWESMQESLQQVEELVGKISERGKLGAWWHAKSDVEELETAMESLRVAMADTNFGMNVELAVKVDGVSNQLREEVGDLKKLLGEEFAELRGRLATHLNVDEQELTAQLMKNQKEMLSNQEKIMANQESNQEKQEANQEKIMAKLDAQNAVVASVEKKTHRPVGRVPSTPKYLSEETHADHLRNIVAKVTADTDAKVTSTRIGIKAMGGQGKSVLLLRIAHHPTVLEKFPLIELDGKKVLGGVVWIDVGRNVVDVWQLLSQIKGALKIKLEDDEAGKEDRDDAVKQRLSEVDPEKFLFLLDNVWSTSIDAVQELLEALPDAVRVVSTTREAAVVEATESSEEIDLSELAHEEAVALLREQCPDVEVTDDVASKLATACSHHLLALSSVGAQLRLKCRKKGCTPNDILRAIESHRERILDNKGKGVGRKGAALSIASCLACSYDALEGEEEKRPARGLSVFPPERAIPLGALQKLVGHEDKSETRMVVGGLTEKSILLRFDDDVASLHGLMHEFLGEKRKEKEESDGDGEEGGGVVAALKYFEAYHLVTSDGDHDALKRAMELYGEELGDEEEIGVGELQGSDAKRALLVMAVMTLHSFAEGVGIGVAFSGAGGHDLGTFISLSLAIHNVPEGLAVAVVLIPRGVSYFETVGWSIFSSLPQPLVAIPVFMFVSTALPWLPVGLGFASGAMLYVALFELLPEATHLIHISTTLVLTLGSSIVMVLLQRFAASASL